MKNRKKTTKPTLISVIRNVPEIKELYDELVKKGFTTQQAFDLTQTIIKVIIK